jgi:hypothetical protein
MVPEEPTATNTVTSDITGAVVSVVVVVLSVVELLDVLLFLAQEMTVRLKRNMRIICKIFFIFSSIPIGKYYYFGL